MPDGTRKTPNTTPSTNPQPGAGGNPGSTSRRPSRWRRWLIRAAVTLGVLLLVSAVGLGGAEYYTGRPQFCGSCHVMDPYYETWSKDIHGRKVGARCIDCHYAPGERLTFKAKFKGLSQVASYFSGRYGAGRPRAQVSDSSCLMSSCHGDNAFMKKGLVIGEPRMEPRYVGTEVVNVERLPTVQFYHEKHLNVDAKLAEAQAEVETRTTRLKDALGDEGFERIRRVAVSVAGGYQRAGALDAVARDLNLSAELRADAAALVDAEHRRTRLRQLDGLSCSGCHNFDASEARHLAVNTITCFTCHFTNETFNHGTGECLKCHQAPTRPILVHERPSALAAAAGPVLMDHRDIVARKVDCASCHLDVIQDDSRVAERTCTACHDQTRYLEGFATRTTATVEEYHRVHIAGQRAHCQDCHRVIQHRLIDPTKVASSAGFLEPVLNECQHCHANHHAEQVQLLLGTGGAGPTLPTPSAMLGSRINCRACHTQVDEDVNGDALVRATQQACVACHSGDYAELFAQWKTELDEYTKEMTAKLEHVEQRVAELGAKGRPAPEDVRAGVDAARQNIRLVRVGDGIHNRHYALQLLDVARQNLDDAAAKLPPP
jgi:nitrate/TMAO reductase-like tetraheme cytochrome c subunit